MFRLSCSNYPAFASEVLTPLRHRSCDLAKQAPVLDILNYISMAAGLGLFLAYKRWVATGEVFWVALLLILCVPGCAREVGWMS
jgi:hypothetical protein